MQPDPTRSAAKNRREALRAADASPGEPPVAAPDHAALLSAVQALSVESRIKAIEKLGRHGPIPSYWRGNLALAFAVDEVAADALLAERQQDKQQIARYEKALRKAPMPIRESTLTPEPWDDAYDKWWHENASEAALAGEEDAE